MTMRLRDSKKMVFIASCFFQYLLCKRDRIYYVDDKSKIKNSVAINEY